MQLSDIQNTLSILGKTGVGTDAIGYSLYLYQQLPFRVVAHKVAESGSNSGIYYIEGDVTDFLNGYSYFWIDGRSLEDKNIFTIDSATYDTSDLWTIVTVTENADFKVNANDTGHFLCGRFDAGASTRLKNLGDTMSQMFEEGSLGNISFDKFKFEINDQDRAFYDKVNQTGYFYEKDLVTEIASIQSESEFSVKGNFHTTWIRAKDLYEYNGSTFQYGWVELITGNASGNKFPIVSTNGYSFKVIGHLAKNYISTNSYPIDVKITDKIRIFKSDTYWVQFDIWARGALSEKFSVFSGKLDLGSVDTNDLQRSLSIEAYSVTRDLTSKSFADLRFNSGSNLTRLSEIKAHYMSASLNRIRPINRSVHPDNPLSSVQIAEVGFDVAEGWHILDYYPGGLFRFDLGKWYHVVDEGDFEKSTASVFLAGSERDTINDYPAVLPDHSLDDSELDQIERLWHGGWCRIVIATEEAQFIGGTNRTLNNGTNNYKKLSGLPSTPTRVLFKVNTDRTISDATPYVYGFDSGNLTIPNHMFDLAIWTDLAYGYIYDKTYDLCMGRKQNFTYGTGSNPDEDYPWRYSLTDQESVMALYSFQKFNGIQLLFRNENFNDNNTSGYSNLITRFLQHMSIHFSNGEGWKSNINLMYAGGFSTGAGTTSSLTLDTIKSISRGGGFSGEFGDLQEAMVGMRLMSISANNFLESREILTVSSGSIDGAIFSLTTDPFSNAIAANDRFVVINKNFNMKFLDFGDGFKEGESPDVSALFKASSSLTGNYFLDLKEPIDAVMNPKYIEPLDKVYIGNRNKFDAITLYLSDLVSGNDNVDVSWFLKQTDILVEYYNGLDWVPANNVIVQPTTVVGVNDADITNKVTDDDNVKYRVMFDARDWHTGGYDHTGYASSLSQSPSDIDENSIYTIRITVLSHISLSISEVSLSKLTDLNLVVMWDDIQGWAKNTVEVEDGKYFVATLQTADVALDLFGIELQCRNSLTWLRQAKPITKLEGATGDSLYLTTDYNELDTAFNSDVVLNDSSSESNWATIPRNINFRYLLERILKFTGFVNNKDFRLHHDTFSNTEKNYLNIVGTKYDGMLPIDVGWDGSYVPEDLSSFYDLDYIPAWTFKSTCILRDNGRFYLYAIADTEYASGNTLSRWTSTDMKNWTFISSIILPIGDQVLDFKVIKNRDDDQYTCYASAHSSGRYRIYTCTITSADAFPSIWTEIIGDASYNFGQMAVLHLKGKSSATTNCYRLMCVVRYDDLAVDSGGYPTGDPKLHFYKNEGTISTALDWTALFELVGSSGIDPMFLKANFAVNDGSIAANSYLNQFTLLFKGSDDKLYKTSPRPGDTLESVWDYPNEISANTTALTGMSVAADGYIYNLLNDSDRDAFTLVPTYRDSYVIYGIGNNGYPAALSVNDTIDDFNEDLFWINKTQEMNEIDWFKSDTERIVISDETSTDGKHKRIYLGLRKPFKKILPRFVSIEYQNRCLLRYWNGVEWTNFDNIYQNGRTITDSKFNPIFGFYFPRPAEWVSDTFENVLEGFTYTGLKQKTPSLYWVEISLPSGYSTDKVIQTKGFRNCYTNMFMWKGRSLYMMENWKYTKQIFTIPGDVDQGIKIEGVSYDKSGKNVMINTTDDNPYTYNASDTYIVDVFGVSKNSYPVWSKGYWWPNQSYEYDEFQFLSSVRPDHLVRSGSDNEYTVGGSSKSALLIGGWDEEFLKEIYGAASLDYGPSFSGYNFPVPFEQRVRKYWTRNMNWTTPGTFVNNIWLARRFGINIAPSYSPATIYQYSNSYAYLVGSLAQVGLLNEELINHPSFNLTPGYYAAVEKNLKTKYEWLTEDIQGVINTYPSSPIDGQLWLISSIVGALHPDFVSDDNSILQYHSATTSWTFIRPYRSMVIKDLSDSDKLWLWNGYKWEEISDTQIWEGRTAGQEAALQWMCGNEGIRLNYFRDWDLRPDRLLNNNTNNILDKKVVRGNRDIPWIMYTSDPLMGLSSDSPFPSYMKPTCAVEVPDLASIKDSDGPATVTEDDGYETRTVKVQEPASPAMVLGMYAFKDGTLNDAATGREASDVVYPYAYSGIGLYKHTGKVKNWLSALYYDGVSAYTDITDNMNYKTIGNNYDVSGGKYIYVCSQTRFFSMNIATDGYAVLTGDFLKKDGITWSSLTPFPEPSILQGDLNVHDHWSYKTDGATNTINPFQDEWGKATFQGVEGYWFRISRITGTGNVQWVSLNGTMLWDNMRWWEDYTIYSDKKPTGTPSDVEKRFFDTYIPMSVEYDIINKKVIGSFWNYDPNVNEYYPFRIPFDREQLFNDSGEFFWSWDNQETLDIVDDDKYDYTRNIKSIATISHIDSKALLVDDSSPDKAPILANIKSLKTGDKLFSFEVAS